ncbi:MAG TPA: hypothetical protein VMV73_05275 [Candidatus Dormibacteraeota bacterium]|nr:hypothetical protein [Candidatus Dormibacteraeota bacterium]
MFVSAYYARAAAYLARTRLPAYVSFVERASAHGIGHDRDVTPRVYVRTADGAIVSGVPPADSHAYQSKNGTSYNPFSKHWLFHPRCYVPTSANQTQWNGHAALRIELKPTCKGDSGITELYADPQTLRPIAVDGNIVDPSDPTVITAIELRYATIDRYTVPSSLRVHVVGHGWLFWMRERADVEYTEYEFYQAAPVRAKQ